MISNINFESLMMLFFFLFTFFFINALQQDLHPIKHK